MRNALACTAMLLVASRAFADVPAPGQPAPGPASEPMTTPQTPAETPAAPKPESKPDPALGEKPDPAYSEPPEADGGPGYFASPTGHDYYVKTYPDRTKKNEVELSVCAGASVVIGAIGLYFHIDSRDKANEISAHKPTGEAWNPDHQAAYDDAHSSAVKAGVFYGIGGALLLGTAIAYMITEPKQETVLMHPHVDSKPTALVAPMPGGALVGGTWSF